MMKKLDQRGVAALEFCLVAVPLFTLMFVVFDLGRYAITIHSLQMLANAEARANMINCYTVAKVINNTSPSACTGDYLSPSQKQTVAPLVSGATVTTTAGTGTLTVTASLPSCGTPPCFSMLMPIWGIVLNAPSASTSIPF